MTDNLGVWLIPTRSRDNWGMNWICFLDSLTPKTHTRHQNYICTIYSSWEKWTCMHDLSAILNAILNISKLPGFFFFIFLETGDLLKRLTPLAYLYHFAAHGTSFVNICCQTSRLSCYYYYFLWPAYCTFAAWAAAIRSLLLPNCEGPHSVRLLIIFYTRNYLFCSTNKLTTINI